MALGRCFDKVNRNSYTFFRCEFKHVQVTPYTYVLYCLMRCQLMEEQPRAQKEDQV
jgi:hypothetical protein